MPKFIITYGPPGCGKSTISKQQYANYVIIDVDEIVAGLDGFLDQSTKICRMLQEGVDRKVIERKAYYLYQGFRDTADRKSEELLFNSIKHEKDIVFETTGGSNKSIKYLKDIIQQITNTYIINIVFPHCPITILTDRIYDRGKDTGRLPSEEFLFSSYQHACDHFPEIANLCNEVTIYDTSESISHVIYSKYNNQSQIIDYESLKSLPLSLLNYINQ